MNQDELRNKLGIDLLNLDQELMEMPVLVQDAAEQAALANDEERAARHNFDLVQSEAARKLRSIPEGSDKKPPSEEKLKSLLPLEEDVANARIAYDAAQTTSAVANALVSSLREKARMLQKISDLIIAGYITKNFAVDNSRQAIRR